MNRKTKAAVLISFIGLFLIIWVYFKPLSILGFAPLLSSEGKVVSITYAPQEPLVSEPLTITVDVKNDGEERFDYKLYVLISKDGFLKESNNYHFSLNPDRSTSVSLEYLPDDIGKFEVVAKLFDEYETELVDYSITNFLSISHIGPFDLVVDTPTKTVSPGDVVPIILSFENMGSKGTDVEVLLEMTCFNQRNIAKSFLIFLESRSTIQKTVDIATCNEVGLHDIAAKVILFNKTWIYSMSQVFLNTSIADIVFEPLESYKTEAGKTLTFDLLVKNSGNIEINNLRILVESIPLDWVSVNPSSVQKLESNSSALFLVNVTVPGDVKKNEYPIKIDAAADQIIERKSSNLLVSVTGESVEVGGPSFIQSQTILIIAAFIVVLGTAALLSYLKKRYDSFTYY